MNEMRSVAEVEAFSYGFRFGVGLAVWRRQDGFRTVEFFTVFIQIGIILKRMTAAIITAAGNNPAAETLI